MIRPTILFLFCSTLTSAPTVIIIDLDVLVVAPTTKKIADTLGWGTLMRYAVMDIRNPFNVVHKLNHLLANIPALKRQRAPEKKNSAITEDLFSGAITSQELLRTAFIHLEELFEQGFFSSKLEQKLYEDILEMLYHPPTYVTFLEPARDAEKLMQLCAKQTDASGAPLHTLMVFASWFADATEVLLQAPHFKKLFKHVAPRHIFATADLGYSKNNPHALSRFIKKHKLNSDDCLVIDAQESLLLQAHALGIKALKANNTTILDLIQELRRTKVIV